MRVASFFCPRPEHPFFQDYRPFLALLRASCERYGCEHRVLTDDPTLDDAWLVDVPRSLMPAFLAAQHQYLSHPDNAETPTLLVGADCVLAHDPRCFQCGGDVVVTVDERFTDCRINMGAVFVPRPGRVAHVWADALARCGDEWGDDQRAFRDALAAAEGVFVVELPCDEYNRAPDYPDHDCSGLAAVLHFRGPRKEWMVDYCHKWLGLGEGVELKTAPNMPEPEMLEHVRVNLRRALPEVTIGVGDAEKHAVLVGGGPSLAETLYEVRHRQDEGQTVFGLNGAARFLLENGVVPDYGVILDPRRENMRFLCDGVGRWLLASQCHPDLVAACPGTPLLWHFGKPDDPICALLPPWAVLTGGGITVGITAMGLAHTMGYRKLHLYGYDSSDADGAGHAYLQQQNEAEAQKVVCFVGRRRFVTTPGMYAQASVFEKWALTLADAGSYITVHGDGLLPAIAHEMAARVAAAEQELEVVV